MGSELAARYLDADVEHPLIQVAVLGNVLVVDCGWVLIVALESHVRHSSHVTRWVGPNNADAKHSSCRGRHPVGASGTWQAVQPPTPECEDNEANIDYESDGHQAC